MENVIQIFHIAAEFGLTPLNLVLIVMLYFMGASTGIFPKFWGNENTSKLATSDQMERLSNYYNHDTTEILRTINANIVEVKSAVEKLEESLHELKTQNSEWEKYGVKIRK